MPNAVAGEFVDVPRPVAVFLEATYFTLLAFGFLASVCSTCCLLWRFFGNGRTIFPFDFSTEETYDREAPKNEEPCEECVGLEFGNDTDEEYMRRPY